LAWIKRDPAAKAISLHILTQGKFIFSGVVLSIEKDFMGKCIDIGKDRQILIQGHGKLSTHFSLKK
jgi:hypothetical protein